MHNLLLVVLLGHAHLFHVAVEVEAVALERLLGVGDPLADRLEVVEVDR